MRDNRQPPEIFVFVPLEEFVRHDQSGLAEAKVPKMIDPTAAAGLTTQEIVATLAEPTALPVLDVGAGWGNFTEHLSKQGFKVIATDIDSEDYIHSKAPFVVANVENGLPIWSACIGGAAAIEVIEHLEAPVVLLRELARVLVRDGWVVLTTPNVLLWGSRLKLLIRGHHEEFDDHAYLTRRPCLPNQRAYQPDITAAAGSASSA